MRRLLGGVMALLIVAGAAGGSLPWGRIRGGSSSQAEEVEKHPLALRAEVLTGPSWSSGRASPYQLKDGESLRPATSHLERPRERHPHGRGL